ncbi:hypothetical protein CCACVL1_01696 [Corchorus capsularis]|uniref:Uncharacterized protein n=1 Tax=Corchorus capsularis TaxID=210143 RepID=A0A1R3KGE2_COCAP|nr:hypothetical protein CCACVL1_01696 [Corchorus capsularis]
MEARLYSLRQILNRVTRFGTCKIY